MTTRYFKVIHKAGAFIDGVHYPCADDQEDVTDSIVALELKKGDKAPLWGVEVDARGNEIGERPDPYSVQNAVGNELADKIAAGAGQGKAKEGTKAAGTKAEAEQRKQTILDTLALLDHSKDEDWNKTDGKPKVEVVAAASGLSDLTRAEIDEAAPDFKREEKQA